MEYRIKRGNPPHDYPDAYHDDHVGDFSLSKEGRGDTIKRCIDCIPDNLLLFRFMGVGIVSLMKLGRYLKPYRKQCIAGPFFKLVEAVLELYLPLLMAHVIDQGIAGGNRPYILHMGGIMLLIVTLGLSSALVCQYMASVASQGFGTELRNAMFRHVSSLSHTETDRFGVPSLINRVTSDVNQLQYAVAMLIRLVIRAPFLCIGGIIMAMTIDLRLSLVIIAAIPLLALIIAVVMKMTVKLQRIVQQRLDRLTLVLRENLSGVRVIRAFARTKEEQNRFDEAADRHTDASIRVGRLSAVLNPLTQLIMNIGILAIVWFGGVRVETGHMTTGDIIAFINYVNMILQALVVVANLVVTFTKAYASAGRVLEVLDTKPGITDGKSGEEIPDAPAVVFSHVNFSYSKGENGVDAEDELTDIDVTIPRGATVGVIGGTGSGKTTLMNLIPRFYDVSGGAVLVNGRDVREYPLDELRGRIGLVPQKAELFTGTVAENIRFGKADASDDDVRRAADIAQAADFIERMPKGYDAPVERGGANLSGGQKQRLTIARALVRSPQILILDDASSALDYATDAALRRAIRRDSRDRTLFIISQRVSAVMQADIILVMDDGRLAGAGSHEELLQTCETYKEIVNSQQLEGGVAQ